jgi:hypothetical protein
MEVGVEAEAQADGLVGRAFGLGSQAYWRGERREVPSLDKVDAALAFLAGLGVDAPADQAAAILKFPELLAIDQALMEGNVGKLQKNFFMKGKALAAAIKRKPRVLGATVDCEGTCAGECTRCFAQF